MNYSDKIKKEINKVFYTDVSNTIQLYLFGRCLSCKQDLQYQDLNDAVYNKFYCGSCVRNFNIRVCSNCDKFYDILDNLYYCRICLGCCKVKCNECIDDKDIPFMDHLHYYSFWLEWEMMGGLDRSDTDIELP